MNVARIAAGAGALMALSASCAHAVSALAVSDVKVRQGPGANYRIVGTIPGGSTVEVSGCRSHWCMIMWPGGRGYAMAASFVRASAPPPGAYAAGPGPGAPPGLPPAYPPPPVYPPGTYPPGSGRHQSPITRGSNTAPIAPITTAPSAATAPTGLIAGGGEGSCAEDPR